MRIPFSGSGEEANNAAKTLGSVDSTQLDETRKQALANALAATASSANHYAGKMFIAGMLTAPSFPALFSGEVLKTIMGGLGMASAGYVAYKANSDRQKVLSDAAEVAKQAATLTL